MLSNSSKYAIKAVLYLALHSSGTKRIMVKDICKPINVPQAYIAKLLQELVRQQIISSARGPKGGFYLSDENRQRSVVDIIHVIDGEKRMKSCMLSLKDCNEDRPCPLHGVMGSLRQNLIKSLENSTINDLTVDITGGKAFLPL